MKGLAIAASLALLVGAAPVFAQGAAAQPPPATKPAGQQPPAQQPPKPAVPVQPAVPVPTPVTPAAPFPAGAKLAVVNLQAIASNSAEGKALAARVQTLMQKKQTEGAEKSKQLQANQAKLQ